MSVSSSPSRLHRWHLALVILSIITALLWGVYEWLLNTAQTKLNERLRARGLSLNYSSKTWSPWRGLTLKDAVLGRLNQPHEPLIELSALHVDILWREAWQMRAAVTRWRSSDATLALHDPAGAVTLEHFTTNFVLRDDGIDLTQLETSNGALAFAVAGKIKIGATTNSTDNSSPFVLDLSPLRGALDTFNFTKSTGLFTVTGSFELDFGTANVAWRSELRGNGKQVEWRGLPMREAALNAMLSQSGLKVSSQIAFEKGAATIDLTREGWEQQPLLISGTLTDSSGNNDAFKGRHDGNSNTLTIARLSGNANLVELARNVPALASQIPGSVKVTEFPDLVAQDLIWKANASPPNWTLASVQLRTPAALSIIIREHPLTINHLTGHLSYDHKTWQFEGIRGHLMDGEFTLAAYYDGVTLSKAEVTLETLQLARLAPWLDGIKSSIKDADLSLVYHGGISNDLTQSTGTGTIAMTHAPVVQIPFLDAAFALFPTLLPEKSGEGTGDLQSTFTMDHGIATIDSLKARGDSIVVKASGTVNLVERQVQGTGRANLRGILGVATFPLSHILMEMQISGPFDDIQVSPLTPGDAVKGVVTDTVKVAGKTVKFGANVLREGLSLPFEALGMFSNDTPKAVEKRAVR